MSQTPAISAVVLCFNSASYIENCVRKLFSSYAEIGEHGDVWVIENGSTDGSADILRRLQDEFVQLKVIYETQNTGTTQSRNKGIEQSSGEFVLVLDSDATVNADVLSHLLAILRNDSTIGIAVPQLRYPDGRFQMSTDQFPTLARKFERFFRLRELEAEQLAPADAVDIDYAISALWLIPRRVFNTVGLLDEKIFYSPEDVDFCIRVWLAGFRIRYEPGVWAFHDAQELSRGTKISKFLFRHLSGLCYYFNKHGYWFSCRRIYRRIEQAQQKTTTANA